MSHEIEAKEMLDVATDALKDFGVNAEAVGTEIGVNTIRIQVKMGKGTSLNSLYKIQGDVSRMMRGKPIRILAPIAGTDLAGIEIPTTKRDVVTFDEIAQAVGTDANKLNVAIGKDSYGNPLVIDLHTTPHVLVAGKTGSGKSVCINSMICSMVGSLTPSQLQLALIDPKVVEMVPYKTLPHLAFPIAQNAKQAEAVLSNLVEIMEARKLALGESGSRNILAHRAKGNEMPFIVCVIDELANLIQSDCQKSIEASIAKLTAEARAFGIHLVLATQRPSVNVVTGVIKANVPVRIAFSVATAVDSRVILDEDGAEALAGRGDMIYKSDSLECRAQGCFVTDDDVDAIVAEAVAKFPKEAPAAKAAKPVAQAIAVKEAFTPPPNGKKPIISAQGQSLIAGIALDALTNKKSPVREAFVLFGKLLSGKQ